VESATRATTVQGLRGDASAAAADPLPVVSKLSSLSTGSTELVENREKRCSEKEDCSLSSNERSAPEDATLLAGTLDLAPHLVTVASPPPTTNKQTNKQGQSPKRLGYAMAVVNVVLYAYGFVLTSRLLPQGRIARYLSRKFSSL